jgi:carbonic anhydrase
MDLIYRYDPFGPQKWQPPTDADEALRLLYEGHQRFADFVRRMRQHLLGDSATEPMVVPLDPVSLGLPLWHEGAPTQMPFALVLGCSDARVPVERVFDQAFNNLFVVRIAGNVLGTECLGSFDFAVRRLANSLKLVVVLGHTSCGAVTAAVDMYVDPGDYSEIACTHSLRSLVDRIMIAVRGAAKALDRACGPEIKRHAQYRAALVEATVYLNSAITAFDLRRELQVMSLPTAKVVFGVYDLDTLVVRGVPDMGSLATSANGLPLLEAPESAECFHELAVLIAKAVAQKHLR